MIVNVNPYDTGHDENLHVMKFAAVAQEVTVTRSQLPPPPPPVIRSALASIPSAHNIAESRRESADEVQAALVQHVPELSQEDEADEEEEDDEEDVFVEHLLDEIRELRIKVGIGLFCS